MINLVEPQVNLSERQSYEYFKFIDLYSRTRPSFKLRIDLVILDLLSLTTLRPILVLIKLAYFQSRPNS